MSQEEFATQNASPEELAAPAPAPEAEVTPEVEAPAEESAAPAPAEEAPKEEQSKAVKELIAQRKKRQAAEQEAAYWRGVAESKAKPEAPAQVATPPGEVTGPVEPNVNDFATYADFERAERAYFVELAKAEMRQEIKREQTAQQQAVKQQTFQEKIMAAIKADPEFEEIIHDNSLPISNDVLPLLQESDVAPELIRYLHNNRDHAKKMFYMSPIQAAKEIGAIEAQLKHKPTPAPPPKKVSQAPEPTPTVTPQGSGVLDEDSLPIDQWIARRNKAQFGR